MPWELIPQALCRVEDVKELMTAGTGPVTSKPDTLLTLLINAFTVAAEKPGFCNRLFLLTERTHYFDGGYSRIWLPASPISVAEDGITPLVRIWDDTEHEWGDDTELTLWDDFGVNLDTGCITLDGQCFGDGSRSVKSTWTGGLVTSGQPDSAPSDLRLACTMQVLNWYQRKSELGLDALNVPSGGSIQMTEPSKFLRAVTQILLSNKRFRGPFA
jgi:hypothetical protein